MSDTTQSNKNYVRKDYRSCNTICYLCKRIGKQKSKQFNTLYGLKYHLTTEHSKQDEISARVSRKQILQTIRAISQALEWKMLIDLTEVDTKLVSEGQELVCE